VKKEKVEQQFKALFEDVKQQGSFNGVVLVAVGGEAVLCEAMGIAEYKTEAHAI
jgi:hypothetical protein